jgi:hypothetical protein
MAQFVYEAAKPSSCFVKLLGGQLVVLDPQLLESSLSVPSSTRWMMYVIS